MPGRRTLDGIEGAVNLAIGPDARLRPARINRWKLGRRGKRAMAKPRKPDAARKPPVPSESHADIEDWIRRVMPDLHPIVKRLDELIWRQSPGFSTPSSGRRRTTGCQNS